MASEGTGHGQGGLGRQGASPAAIVPEPGWHGKIQGLQRPWLWRPVHVGKLSGGTGAVAHAL